MRRAVKIVVVIFFVAIAALMILPEARLYFFGLLKGEAFAKGMPLGYWKYVLRNSSDEELRILAANSLLESVNEHQIEPDLVFQSLEDTSPRVRAIMAECVRSPDGGPEMIGKLASLLNDSDGPVRARTASALGRLVVSDGAIEMALAKQAESDSFVQAKVAAIFALGMYGESGRRHVPLLINSLRESDSQYGSPHDAAVFSLSRICKTNPDLLSSSLATGEPRVRSGILKSLGSIGSEAKNSLPEVLRLAKSDDPLTRIEATQAQWRIEKKPEQILKVSIRSLSCSHTDPRTRSSVRLMAIFLLGEIGSEAESAAPKLVEILKTDPEIFPRKYAAMALGKIGKSPEVLEALREAAKTDKDPDVCWAANEALKDK